jgi:hypothetical protein
MNDDGIYIFIFWGGKQNNNTANQRKSEGGSKLARTNEGEINK